MNERSRSFPLPGALAPLPLVTWEPCRSPYARQQESPHPEIYSAQGQGLAVLADKVRLSAPPRIHRSLAELGHPGRRILRRLFLDGFTSSPAPETPTYRWMSVLGTRTLATLLKVTGETPNPFR